MIHLQGISRIFKVGGQDVNALDAVDLHISSGEYLSVMGPSGSGKSTLLNIIGLLDSPTQGSYTLDGHDVTSLNDDRLALVRREKIGFIFQFFHLVPRLSARQNIELPLLLAGVNNRERTRRSSRVIEDFGLVDRAHHLPEELSGGQRQRVAIARAVINKPAVLLADEPTGNLDQKSGVEIIKLLEQLNADGIMLIVVTHDVEVGSRANRYVKFVDGRIVSDTRQEEKCRISPTHEGWRYPAFFIVFPFCSQDSQRTYAAGNVHRRGSRNSAHRCR